MTFAELRPRREGKRALDSQARAMRRVCDSLRRNNPAVFPPEVDARIRSEFTGLATGNAPLWKG